MKHTFRPLLLLLWLCVAPVLVLAQTDCPLLVDLALKSTNEACKDTGRNQACYGNVLLEAKSQPDVQDFQFSQPGDIVDVTDIESLHLSDFNADDKTWGVALMRIQANLPDTLPGQNVTFVLFGDVQIWNAGSANTTLQVGAQSSAIVYERPSSNARIVGQFISGQVVTAVGRLEDSSWIRIQLLTTPVLDGWVESSRLVPDTNLQILPVLDPANSSSTGVQSPAEHFGPMQAFYFQTGIHQYACQEVPTSGILIQAPAKVGPVKLRVNDVDMVIGSTAFLQAEPDKAMTVSVIEGGATITVNNQTRPVPAGTQVQIPMTAQLSTAGDPSLTTPYTAENLQSLPTTTLERDVTIAPPLTPQQIAVLGSPTPGNWHQYGFVAYTCPNATTQTSLEEDAVQITDVTGTGFTYMNLDSPNAIQNAVQFQRSDPSGVIYTGEWQNRNEWVSADYTYTLVAQDRIIGHVTAVNQEGCTEEIDRELHLD